MAYTFPLTIAQFFDLLPIEQITFDAPEQNEVSQTGKGELITAELAPMIWTGEVRLGPLTNTESAPLEMFLDVLRPAGRTFYAYDPRRRFPLADPTGSILGAANPLINSLPNSREMTIKALPANYVLTAGDYLAFTYNGTRRALHRMVTSATASALGVTPVFEVTPPIRTGAAVNAAVTLIRPSCKALILPGSVSKGMSRQLITRDVSFRFQQTLGL